MEFEISCCYLTTGEQVFREYPQLEKYPHRIEGNADYCRTAYITINSLEELLKIQKEIKQDLILDKNGELVIYDGYVE